MTFVTDEEDLDELSQLLHDPLRNSRHDVWLWLWLYLFHDEARELDRNTCNSATMRHAIARALRRNSRLIERIPREKIRHLVPDEQLAWITKDERQNQWLLSIIDDLTGKNFPRGFAHLTGRSRIIAMLDVWEVDIEVKAQEIDHLHERWRRHIARDSQFEWFADKKEGKKRCICAWEWIEKNHLGLFSRNLPISNYSELLIFFDQAKLGPHEQKAMIQEIKKRWSRQQFDERNSDKKQINVMISKEVISLLDDLAKRHDLKRAKVLETLIRMESDTGVYLTEG